MTRAEALIEWLVLCAESREFVSNYNRLTGARVSLAPPVRTPFERLIDRATGHVPAPKNDPRELTAFMDFCRDMFERLPLPEQQSE